MAALNVEIPLDLKKALSKVAIDRDVSVKEAVADAVTQWISGAPGTGKTGMLVGYTKNAQSVQFTNDIALDVIVLLPETEKLVTAECKATGVEPSVFISHAVESYLNHSHDPAVTGTDSPQVGVAKTRGRSTTIQSSSPTSDVTGAEQWLEMLRYILTHGDKDTQDAITRNLDRFHLLARLLNQEPRSHERSPSPIPEPPPDQQARMDRIRELGSRHGGSRKNPGEDETGLRRQTGSDPKRPGPGRKH